MLNLQAYTGTKKSRVPRNSALVFMQLFKRIHYMKQINEHRMLNQHFCLR